MRLSSGTCNQRLKLRNALLLASLSHRTLVLPRVFRTRSRHGAAWADADPESSWRDEALSALFDLPYLMHCAAKHGVWVISEPMPGTPIDDGFSGVTAPLVPTALEEAHLTPDDPRLFDPESSLSLAPHLFVRDLELWSGRVTPQLLAAQVSHDVCITWAAPLVTLATQLADAYVRVRGTPLAAAIAVHLRVEDDMLSDFSPRVRGVDGIDVIDTSAIAARMMDKAMLCLARVAPPSEDGAHIYVITGEDPSSIKLSPLRAAYGSRMGTKEDLLPDALARATAAWGIDGIVALNFQLALETAEFVGYGGSTFSQQVARERLARGKVSFLYNDIGVETPECALVESTTHVRWVNGQVQQFF